MLIRTAVCMAMLLLTGGTALAGPYNIATRSHVTVSSAKDADRGAEAEIRQYESLLRDADYAGQDFTERMNENSEHIFAGRAEPYLAEAAEGTPFQLLRTGYYKKCTEQGRLVLSEIVSLKDNFNKK